MSEYLVLFDVHETNRRWVEENYSALVEGFDRKFVAIYNQKVIDSDNDLDKLIERVESSFPLEKVSIEYVTQEKKFDPPAPFVEAILISKGLHISKLVDLHIDTGASSSMLYELSKYK